MYWTGTWNWSTTRRHYSTRKAVSVRSLPDCALPGPEPNYAHNGQFGNILWNFKKLEPSKIKNSQTIRNFQSKCGAELKLSHKTLATSNHRPASLQTNVSTWNLFARVTESSMLGFALKSFQWPRHGPSVLSALRNSKLFRQIENDWIPGALINGQQVFSFWPYSLG